jgi:DNA-binding NtrC family response regulator
MLNNADGDVVDWLSKPIDQQRLLTALRRAVQRTRATRPHILHVEDDGDVAAIIGLLLDEIADVTTASTISEAQTLLKEQSFDLVILDQILPDGNGIELLPLIEQQQPPLPIILFSVRDLEPEIASRVAVTMVKSRTTNTELITAVSRLLDQTPKTIKEESL